MRQGPYFNNVQYISPLPSGYMETAAQMAKTQAAGISSLGDSIAGAIKQYSANKEERDYLDQKFEMAAPTLEKYKDIAKDDPRLQKLVDGLGKFSSMSNTQKKAYLNNAEFAISQVEKEQIQKYQRDQDMMKMDLANRQAAFEGVRLGNDTQRLGFEEQRLGLEQQQKAMERQRLDSALATAALQQQSAQLQINAAKQDATNQQALTNAFLNSPGTRQDTVVAPMTGLMDTSRFINGPTGPQMMEGSVPFSTTGTARVPVLSPQAQAPGTAPSANLANFMGAGIGNTVAKQQGTSPVIPAPRMREIAFDAAPQNFDKRAARPEQTSGSAQSVEVKLTPEERFAGSLQRYVDNGGQLDMKSVKELREYFGANKDEIELKQLGGGITGVMANGKLREIVQTKSEAVKLSESDKTFMMNAAEYRTQLNQLEDSINTYGTAEVLSSKGSADLGSASYKLAVLYAKIVDPNSVAKEGEVEAAKKYVIPMGPNVRTSTALAALKNQREEILRRVGLFEQINGVKVPSFGSANTTSGASESAPSNRKFNTSGKEIR